MADFSSRFAVAITADDQTAAGSDKASRTMTDALSKPAGAAKLASSETAKAFEKGINRPLDQAKKKTDAADKAVRSLKDRIAARWHTGGAGKAFDSIGAARMATASFASDIGSAFSPAQDLAALLAGGSLFTAVSKFDNSANELSRTAARFDISTDALQRWRGAVRLGGLDADTATQSIDALSRTMFAAAKGQPEGAQAMSAASGIQLRTGVKLDFTGTQTQFLKDLNRAFQQMSPATQRIAARAFGVEPMLDELKKTPAQLEKDLGDAAKHRNLTPTQIKAGDEGNRSIVAATDSTIGFAQAVAANLAPAFTPIFNGYSHWLDELKQSPVALDAVGAGAALLSTVLAGKLFRSVSNLTSAVSNFSSTWKDSPLGKGAAPGGVVPGGAAAAAATPGVPAGVIGATSPAAGMLGTGLAYSKSLQDRKQWDSDFGAAKKKYADDVKALHAWIVQYNHDHPFVAPYGPGTADALAPLGLGADHPVAPTFTPGSDRRRNFDSTGRPIPQVAPPPFEPVTPKVMSPHSEAAPSGAPALSQSGAAAFAPSNAYAPPMSEIDVAKYFEGQGWTPARARGITAGAYAESKLDPNAVNPKSGAYGIGQWLGPRRKELFRQFGPQPTMNQQLAFLDFELKGGDRGGYAVQSATTDTGAMDAYIRRFMRPKAGAETSKDIKRGLDALSDLRAPGEMADGPDDAEPQARRATARRPVVAPTEMPPDLAAYEPGQSDSSHEVMVRFVDAPRGLRADVSRAKGPAKLGVRIEHSMPV